MFWRMTGISTTSPVESLLDKDEFTLEELLHEDELIQECKSLNTRLINFLRGKSQIQQLLKYVVEEPPEGSDNNRVFKFPFVASEIFTCEIEVIMKTTVEDEELMGLLFSFLDPNCPHGTLLAGYFSKVTICLLMRKTAVVMRYLQAHQEILKKLVDIIYITSIMEVLIRLMGADDTIHAFHADSFHWLAETDLLEMLMDKLSPPNSSEAHANAADTLSAIARLPQSELAKKLSSPSFIARLFNHALEEQDSKSTLVHSLTVCISLLEPKKFGVGLTSRGQHLADSLATAKPETVDAMLQRLGDLLVLLDVQADERVLPTTYGELQPPLGTHRLKIVEFFAVLLRTDSKGARQKLVELGAVQLVLKLFYDYPFNNLLHHHVENMVKSCLEGKSKMLLDHVLVDCDLVGRLVQADRNPLVLNGENKPTIVASGKAPPRIGNLGHLTRIANRLVQAAHNNPDIHAYLQGKPEWLQWHSEVLQSRNSTENVSAWTCGRPTTIRDRPIDSDDDDYREKDYDISTMASNLTREVFRYGFDHEDGDEELGITERDDDDVFFDDESAEVVISSLRFREEQESARAKDSFLSGPNWFSFKEDRASHFLMGNTPGSLTDRFKNVSSPNNISSTEDEVVVVGEDDDLVDTATSPESIHPSATLRNGSNTDVMETGPAMNTGEGTAAVNNLPSRMENLTMLDNLSLFPDDNSSANPFAARPPDWASWTDPPASEGMSAGMEFSDTNPFKDDAPRLYDVAVASSFGTEAKHDGAGVSGHEVEGAAHDCTDHSGIDQASEPLFDGSVEFVGVEIEGTAKAMEHALREGIVGEAGPILPAMSNVQTDSRPISNLDMSEDLDFTDVNYWKSGYNQSVAEVESL